MILRFTIPGPPVPKERARVVVKDKKARGITPHRTRKYEQHVGMMALAARQSQANKWPLDAKYLLSITIYHGPNEGDGDNYFKAVADGCEGVLWKNDKSITRGEWRKLRAEPGKERIEVVVDSE